DIHGGVHVHQGDRQPETKPDTRPWLRALWRHAVTSDATIDLRYLTEPGIPCLHGFLLLRAQAPELAAAVDVVGGLRARLPDVLAPASSAPVESEAELRRVLEPFVPHPRGLVEIRKRVTVARSTRGDVDRPWLAAVTPLHYGDRSWVPLWASLAALPFRAVLSVGLAPIRIGRGLRAHLAARATEITRLARPGLPPTGSWNVQRPPDQFAVQAEPLFTEAVGRYMDEGFTLRVSLAAEQPVSDSVAELLADTISPPLREGGFAGATPTIVRPRPDELPTAWRNIAALNFDPLAASYPEGIPVDAIGEVERILASIADIDEAAAAFCLPYASTGNPRLFR
ncbi:MAG: hypothetical protein ACRDQ5_06130, partial [Sciscionella sp.]